MNPLSVVTYYTSPTYKDWATRMLKTARSVGLSATAFEYPDTGSWAGNVAQKPLAILRNMLVSPGVDSLYVDADSRFWGPPSALPPAGYEVACYYSKPGGPSGGTLWLANTPEVRAFLDIWYEENIQNLDASDDTVNLPKALARFPRLRIFHLDPSYCWHEPTMRSRFPGVKTPVIEHFCVGEHSYRRY